MVAAPAAAGELTDATFSSLRHWGRVAGATGNVPGSYSQDHLIAAMITGKAERATNREIARAARCSPATVTRYLRKAAEAAAALEAKPSAMVPDAA